MQSKQSETRQSWSYQEDKLLLELIKLNGCTSWNRIANELQSLSKNSLKLRTSAACRERYQNILNPNLNKSNWTQEEEENLFNLQQTYGNSWAKIASKMPGRSDLLCKNQFYATLRKVLRRISRAVGLHQSSEILKQIKPSVLGVIYCNDNTFKSFNINDKMKTEFQELIRRYKYSDKAILNQLQESEVNYIKSMLNQLFVINNNYLKQKERKSIKKNSNLEILSQENNSKSIIPTFFTAQHKKYSKLESKIQNTKTLYQDSQEDYDIPKTNQPNIIQDNKSTQNQNNLNQFKFDIIPINQSQVLIYTSQPVLTFCFQQNFINQPIQLVQPYYTPEYLPQTYPILRY